MMDQAEIKSVPEDQRSIVMAMVDMMRAVCLPPNEADVAEYSALAMAAGAIFAGTNYGYACAIGVESNDRNRRRLALKMVERNFKSGIDIGLNKASCVADEMGMKQ